MTLINTPFSWREQKWKLTGNYEQTWGVERAKTFICLLPLSVLWDIWDEQLGVQVCMVRSVLYRSKPVASVPLKKKKGGRQAFSYSNMFNILGSLTAKKSMDFICFPH